MKGFMIVVALFGLMSMLLLGTINLAYYVEDVQHERRVAKLPKIKPAAEMNLDYDELVRYGWQLCDTINKGVK